MKELCPIVNVSPDLRYPVLGATLQRRGGVARHDRVAWAYGRGADRLGVDIVEHCEVQGFEVKRGRAVAVETTRGTIKAKRIALASAGHTSVLASMLGIRLPLQSHPLQALVSVLLEPVIDTVVMSNAVHVYVSQADKGELVMGAGIDAPNSYTQRGSFGVIEHQMSAAVELFPIFAQAKLLRTWGGIVDVSPDASPIVGLSPVKGVFLNCGWGTGGFKATPGIGDVYADTIANGRPHPLAEPFAPGAVHDRRADRRARRRGGGALDAADPLPVVRPEGRDRVLLRRPGAPRLPRRPRGALRRRVGRLPVHARQPQGRVRRALDARRGMPPLVQRRAQHRDERDPRLLRDGAVRAPSEEA